MGNNLYINYIVLLKRVYIYIERFTSEKGKTRGGGKAPRPKLAEKTRFCRETTGRMV